jgi:hypothetical protein
VVRLARHRAAPPGGRLTRRAASGLAPWALGLFLLGGCGEVRPQVSLPDVAYAPTPADAARAPMRRPAWDRSLEGLRRDDQRVADVAFRLATANVELCSDIAPLSGLVLQSALQYGPRVRPAARAMFGLDDRPQVEAVAAGSPAAAAGLAPGDILVAVDDALLSPPQAPPPGASDDRPATFAPLAEAYARLVGALARGPTRLTLLRGGARLAATVGSQPGCAYDMQVIPGDGLTASADGRHVFISTAMVGFADTDARLALVLGHELAHDLLHHRERLDRAGFARRVLGVLGSSPASLVLTEKEADYVGLYLDARAGYDISQAPDFWRTFPAGAGDFDWTHPSIAERVAALAATRDEIERKRAEGAPLAPEFVPGTGR